MSTDFQTIKLTFDRRIARLTLNRPEVRNAFDEHMIAEIRRAIELINKDDDCRAVLITGEGTAFSSGADVNWMKRMGSASLDENNRDTLALAYMLDILFHCPKPTVARVQGPSIGGGCGLVAACDIAIGSSEAFFSFSEVKIGLVPACIAPYVLNRVGRGRMRELFISGRRINAGEAERIGLLNYLATPAELDLKVEETLNNLSTSGPKAIKAAKELATAVPTQNREEYIKFTARMLANLRTSPEGREGAAAFLEKRKPNWVS